MAVAELFATTLLGLPNDTHTTDCACTMQAAGQCFQGLPYDKSKHEGGSTNW
jgi:hypothetical protein